MAGGTLTVPIVGINGDSHAVTFPHRAEKIVRNVMNIVPPTYGERDETIPCDKWGDLTVPYNWQGA